MLVSFYMRCKTGWGVYFGLICSDGCEFVMIDVILGIKLASISKPFAEMISNQK